MKLHAIIASPNAEFCEIANWRFQDVELVEVVHGKFESVDHFDCVVTAGNSFGLMDAGIDLAVVKFFGITVQERVQQAILNEFLGEQPIGTSLLVETDHPKHGFVAHTPSMRAPANISLTDNAYLATWATLIAIHRHNQKDPKKTIYTAVFPAFGTGTGGMDLQESAYQMSLAFDHYFHPPMHLNGSLAQQRFETVHYGSNWGFQHPRTNFPI